MPHIRAGGREHDLEVIHVHEVIKDVIRDEDTFLALLLPFHIRHSPGKEDPVNGIRSEKT